MANCASKTQRSQQEASNRLGTRIEDCNSWRADLQTELDNNIRSDLLAIQYDSTTKYNKIQLYTIQLSSLTRY